ncbi:hypothetical protein RESH_00494 [Rhodopirellula europaea SH398]|uniref:Uncharacterized protein n=1 Tax=Rhodopirellula europaea SH398 TaxID=1263868 RepID=M5SRT7_9BACT|nr:hypothetical protein RESH_00494 [Rhodopirellula europaea SH398]
MRPLSDVGFVYNSALGVRQSSIFVLSNAKFWLNLIERAIARGYLRRVAHFL